MCPPRDSATSCRALRGKDEGMKVWFGALCATNNCDNPGTAPEVGDKTCDVQWGATKPGYNKAPGHGINQPGWYDWKTGSFKLDQSRGKPTCGELGICLGERTGKDWDMSIVATPRSGQAVPCLVTRPATRPGASPSDDPRPETNVTPALGGTLSPPSRDPRSLGSRF